MTSTSSNEPSLPVRGVSSSGEVKAPKSSEDFTAVLPAGTLLHLVRRNNEMRTGQFHQLAQGEGDFVNGSGRILGRARATGCHAGGKAVGFPYAEVTETTKETAARLQASKEAVLEVGTFADSSDLTTAMLRGGFNRHACWCGQSGSGKSHSLGGALEELLLRTGFP